VKENSRKKEICLGEKRTLAVTGLFPAAMPISSDFSDDRAGEKPVFDKATEEVPLY